MLGEKTMLDLYGETVARIEMLKLNFDEVIFIWDCEWRRQKQIDPHIRVFVQNFSWGPDPVERQMSEAKMLELILEEKIHGIIEVDLFTPLHLRGPFPQGHGDFPYVVISFFQL